MRVHQAPAMLAAALLLAPGAAGAAPLLVQVSGTVTGYYAYNSNRPSFRALAPIGGVVTASVVFDDTVVSGIVPMAAAGTAQVAGIGYTAVTAEPEGVLTPQNSTLDYALTRIVFGGVSVAPDNPYDKPGVLSLVLGLPFPDPLGTGVAGFPYSAVQAQFTSIDGTGFETVIAYVALRGGSVTAVTAVPEPAGVAAALAGVAGLWGARRRRRTG